MNKVVEFLYFWVLRPSVTSVYDDEGNITNTVTIKRTARDAVTMNGHTWGRLPSGRTVTTDEVNKFLKQYLI